MSVLSWTLIVIAGYIAGLFLFKAWNKDTSGAVQIAVAIIVIAFLLVSVGCTTTPERRPYMEVGMAYQLEDTVGSSPACVVRLRKPVWRWLTVGYQHISSCRDLDDKNTVDQLEFMATIPLGRDK